MVEILDETNRFRPREALQEALERLMAELDLDERELTVILTTDARIRHLNRDHRGEDQATDVLSYPLNDPDDVGIPQVSHLGDIVISLQAADRQAAGHGHSPLEEVLVLAAHGLTHLQGFDHTTEDAWLIFRNAQTRILDIHRHGL